MLQTIKNWFMELPPVCQKDIAELGGLRVISEKFIEYTSEADLISFNNYMDSNSLSYEEKVKRALIMYSIIDLTINNRINLNWGMDLSAIKIAIDQSNKTAPVITDPKIQALSDKWDGVGKEAFDYTKKGKALWEEVEKSWMELKKEIFKDFNIIYCDE
jgi:hypothetical protein